MGVVHDPMRDETFSAAVGGPACLDDVAIRASDKASLADYVVSLALGGRAVATRVRSIRKAIRVSRNMGSAALALAYVANGRFDAFVQSAGMSAWDVAAAGLIAERAGATVTDMTGGAVVRRRPARPGRSGSSPRPRRTTRSCCASPPSPPDASPAPRRPSTRAVDSRSMRTVRSRRDPSGSSGRPG